MSVAYQGLRTMQNEQQAALKKEKHSLDWWQKEGLNLYKEFWLKGISEGKPLSWRGLNDFARDHGLTVKRLRPNGNITYESSTALQNWFTASQLQGDLDFERIKADIERAQLNATYDETLYRDIRYFKTIKGMINEGTKKQQEVMVADWSQHQSKKNANYHLLAWASNHFKKTPFALTGEEVNRFLADVLGDKGGEAASTFHARLVFRAWFRFINQRDEESKISGKKGKTAGDYSSIALSVAQRTGLMQELKKAKNWMVKQVEIMTASGLVGNEIVPLFAAQFALFTGTRAWGTSNPKTLLSSCTPRITEPATEGARSIFVIDKGGEAYGKHTKYIITELEPLFQQYLTWLEAYTGLDREHIEELPLMPFTQDEFDRIKREIREAAHRVTPMIWDYDRLNGEIQYRVRHDRITVAEKNLGKYVVVQELFRTKNEDGGYLVSFIHEKKIPKILGGLLGKYFYFKPFHALRHTSAQMYLEATAWNYEQVAETLGWKDIATLKDWYGAPSVATKSKWLKQISNNLHLTTITAHELREAESTKEEIQKAEEKAQAPNDETLEQEEDSAEEDETEGDDD